MAVRWWAHFKTAKEKVRNQPCNHFKKKLTVKPEFFALKIIFQEQRKNKHINQFSSVQSLSHVQLFATPGTWLVGSPCGPRDSQESSPTPQFKSIDSLGLNLLYSPNLTSIHDYWENHSFRHTFVGNIFHQTHQYFPVKTVLHSTYGASGNEPTCQCRRHETQVRSWVRKIPWRRKWQPTPAFLLRKSHGQRSLAGYSS